jgi:RimJ/RimL family protein N-acetyltransferase
VRPTDVETGRLVLHPLSPAEAGRIVGGVAEPGDRWHAEYPFPDELVPLRALAKAADPDPVFTLYQVRERANGLAVGGIGFFGPPGPEGVVELGYGLVAAARGRGFATEALRAAVELAWRNGVALVAADTEPGNTASQRVLEKAGFREAGRDAATVRFELRRPAGDHIPWEV